MFQYWGRKILYTSLQIMLNIKVHMQRLTSDNKSLFFSVLFGHTLFSVCLRRHNNMVGNSSYHSGLGDWSETVHINTNCDVHRPFCVENQEKSKKPCKKGSVQNKNDMKSVFFFVLPKLGFKQMCYNLIPCNNFGQELGKTLMPPAGIFKVTANL